MDPRDQPSHEVARRNLPVDQQALFRPEVMAARQSQWLGTVLLAPSISHRLFALFATLMVAAILSLLFFGSFTRQERINGWLVPDQGLVRVIAPRPGVITRLHVRDGEKVAKGAALVTLSMEVQSAAFGATQQEIVQRLKSRRESLLTERKSQQNLLKEEIDGLTRRIAALRSEQNQLTNELKIQRSQAKLARDTVERLRPLSERGLITATRLESAERNRLDQALKLSSLERQHTAAGRERLILEAEREAMPLRTESRLAELDRDYTTLEQELVQAEAQRRYVITAAQAGTVTALRTTQGSSANTSMPLLSIVPEGSELSAQLFVPSKAIGFIRPGQDVKLRYEAFPYQKFGHHQGAVSAVSSSAVSPNELGAQLVGLTSLLSGDEPVYLVTVRLTNQSVTAYGEAVPLQPGMQLQADVQVEARRLIEWVFDPLYTLTGRQRT